MHLSHLLVWIRSLLFILQCCPAALLLADPRRCYRKKWTCFVTGMELFVLLILLESNTEIEGFGFCQDEKELFGCTRCDWKRNYQSPLYLPKLLPWWHFYTGGKDEKKLRYADLRLFCIELATINTFFRSDLLL